MEFFCEDPAYADMCVVEVLAAGPTAIERRDTAVRALAGIIDAAAKELPKRTLPPAITSQALVGGIYEVMYSRILRGELDVLPSLVPDMLYALLLPYVGREEAAAAQKKVRKRASSKAPAEKATAAS